MADVIASELVMPGNGLLDLAADGEFLPREDDPSSVWLAARNDEQLGSLPDNGIDGLEVFEVRHREHLRIINGRPREFSTTLTRTLKRGRLQ
jgi:hypothetical protein